MRQLQFKFDPFPAKSAGICLFHQRWIKTFDTQPFYQLRIKYGLVFYKNDLVQFCNKYMVGPSQKNSFWALWKWKMIFSSKINENFLRQHRITSLLFFLKTWSHIMTQCEGFPIFWYFWIFYARFKMRSKRRAWPFLASGWILEIFWCFSD